MTIKFYYGSGSPFSWNVWLTLEHKRIPYELKLMSLQSGDLKKPGYLAINPRGKVPALVDDGFVLWESSVIIEYLEEYYRDYPLFPSDLREKTIARRIAAETHLYLYPVLRGLLEQTLFRPGGGGDPVDIEQSLNNLSHELVYFEELLQGEYFVGTLSVADLALYPLLALLKRLHKKQPQYRTETLIGPKLSTFMQAIENLPCFAKTTPPHWKG